MRFMSLLCSQEHMRIDFQFKLFRAWRCFYPAEAVKESGTFPKRRHGVPQNFVGYSFHPIVTLYAGN